MSYSEDSQPTVGGACLRFATDADIEELLTLINAAFVVEQIAIEGDRMDRVGVQKYMRTGRFFVLENAAAMLGCVYVEKRDPCGYLGLLAVHPAQQGRGLGSALTSAAERYFRSEGCSAVDLRVISARAELVAFYEKRGFAVQGTSAMPKSAPLKIPCHYIHMSKNLR